MILSKNTLSILKFCNILIPYDDKLIWATSHDYYFIIVSNLDLTTMSKPTFLKNWDSADLDMILPEDSNL